MEEIVMARFRELKTELMRICAEDGWKKSLEDRICNEGAASDVSSPLLALLPRPESSWQAAFGLGLAVALTAKCNVEDARVFMRRLMWSMNEESGNLGWGIPEAMGCILAQSPRLAGEYSHILISYIYDTGREDNFIDHAPLRRGVYWGIGHLAAANAAAAQPALPHLLKGLEDEDLSIRGMAAFAVAQLAASSQSIETPSPEAVERWHGAELAVARAVAVSKGLSTAIELFDGRTIVTITLTELLGRALKTTGEARKNAAGVDPSASLAMYVF